MVTAESALWGRADVEDALLEHKVLKTFFQKYGKLLGISGIDIDEVEIPPKLT